MADYHPLIARAVAGLDKNTSEARRSLYERARAALVEQLRGATPVLSESDITRERLALEEAIRKIEAEEAKRGRRERPQPASSPPPAPTEDPPPALAGERAASGARDTSTSRRATSPSAWPPMAPLAVEAAPALERKAAPAVPPEPRRQMPPDPTRHGPADQLSEADGAPPSSAPPPEPLVEPPPAGAARDKTEAARLERALRKLRGKFTSGQGSDLAMPRPRVLPPEHHNQERQEHELDALASPAVERRTVNAGSDIDEPYPHRSLPDQPPERPRWRLSGAAVKAVIVVVALAVLAALAAVGYRESGSIVALYHLFSGPPAPVTREEAKTQQPKIEDRVGSAQPDRLPGIEQRTTGPAAQPNKRTPQQLLSDAGHKPYPTADIDDPSAVLTVREHQDGEPAVIARSRWRFAKAGKEGPEPSADHVYLEGGFEAGKVYELTYTALGAPIVGLAFLAFRDAASFLKHASAAEGNPLAGAIDYAYAWGQSMNGRWLREFLYWGLNRDEAGRMVFDGMLPHVGSSRRGEFNIRFGQPSTNILRAPGNTYPFAFEATPEPGLRTNRGLLERSRANRSMPKVLHVNSGMEYWWSGASLGHTTVDGTRDFDPPPEVRIYHLAGAQHGPGALPLSDRNPDGFRAQQPLNTLDYRPAMRALLTALDQWVRAGVEPPPSRVPRVDDGTAVRREALQAKYTRIPGSAWLSQLPQRLQMDFGPGAEAGLVRYPPVETGTYPILVSAMDGDCNEVAGLRLPDVAVPLATYTGWNVRHDEMGQGGLMTSGAPLFGTTLVFPRTRAEREAAGDPRPSIDERYASKEDYLARVRAAAEALVRDRHLLAEDVEGVVEVAARKWDAFRGR